MKPYIINYSVNVIVEAEDESEAYIKGEIDMNEVIKDMNSIDETFSAEIIEESEE